MAAMVQLAHVLVGGLLLLLSGIHDRTLGHGWVLALRAGMLVVGEGTSQGKLLALLAHGNCLARCFEEMHGASLSG